MAGAELRAMREAAGMTQADAAEFLDVDEHTVHAWETGKIGIRHGRLIRMAFAGRQAATVAQDL